MSDLLSLPYEQVLKVLDVFLRDEVRRVGFSKVVLGLSGGVDSAVSAYLAAHALGSENVHCVMMPYKTSSPASLSDAQKVVEALEISSEIVEITPMVDPLFSLDTEITNLRKGNIMARQRMIILYDRSAKLKALVVGTSNKTEGLLGYTTQFGDNASAINPLGDLYKTQVWELAKKLGVPESIISKAPSADLWTGQTDEEEMGIVYKEVDELLYYMVDCREHIEELMKRGFAKAYIEKIRGMIQRSQFKRLPPVIAKVSNRTINADFRYPRDWGN